MTFDFRASQVRTNKIIASGSTGTSASLLIYPFARALDQSGSINSAVFGTGSIGSDVFLFVSGAVNSMGTSTQGTTLLGGDLKVSGAFMSLGSLESYGSVIGYSTFSAFQSASFLSDVTVFGGNYVSGPFIAWSTSRLVGATTISGTITSINTASFSAPVTASSTALFSGATTFSNTLTVTGKLSASLQTLSDGTPYLKAGPNITITTQSNGAVAISGSAGSSYTMQSWIDFERKNHTAYPSEFSGDYSIGVGFYTTSSGSVITGYRFAWSGSANQDIMVTVWSGSTGLVSASVPCTGSASPGVFTGSFGSTVSMAPHGTYRISMRDITGTTFHYFTSGNDFYTFAGTGAYKSARVHPNLVINAFYAYAAGDGSPVNLGGDTYSSAVEPVITFA